jgi:hypothetical protein
MNPTENVAPLELIGISEYLSVPEPDFLPRMETG